MIKDYLQARIINVNNFSIDCEVNFNISKEIFEELNNHINFFNERGLNFTLSSMKINNSTSFYLWVIGRLYPEYKIEDYQKEGNGRPDFKLTKLSREDYLEKCRNNRLSKGEKELFYSEPDFYSFDKKPEEIWIEVKKNSDGLRANQFNWILENKDKTQIRILFIKEDKGNEY